MSFCLLFAVPFVRPEHWSVGGPRPETLIIFQPFNFHPLISLRCLGFYPTSSLRSPTVYLLQDLEHLVPAQRLGHHRAQS